MIEHSAKKRHEIKDNKIRALYGHSIAQKLLKELVEPPEILYHGTTPEVALLIAGEGLKPMGRQYVHLSIDPEMAVEVGKRKAAQPVILSISAQDAYKNKTYFYKGSQRVWLADFIAAEFIKPIAI